MMLPSGNDAALVLACAFGKWLYFSEKTSIKEKEGQDRAKHLANFEFGQEEYIKAFVNEMNKQAKKLKLNHTNFSNPHGLSEKANHASAQDVCKIATYALKYDLIREIV